ncbi:MAG: DUF4402 domain-containing protein [Alphaproteobacteria bacterium]|nr:DUF4402 domain-containing protein [Alphaproteobacteria bacterium]MBN2780172.1 DUF4402 domain-containing protein [Alphaproteobacteria bacterium]
MALWPQPAPGHAQTELSSPLSITNTQNVDFGTIAIDPSAGAQEIPIFAGNVTCPATYVCSGTPSSGIMTVVSAYNVFFHISLIGASATLSDGAGNTIFFDPSLAPGHGDEGTFVTSEGSGPRDFDIHGKIYLTGNEPAGVYNTSNAGGTPFIITINY